MSRKNADLTIAIDLGGSLTKVGAVTADGHYCLLALLSEVAVIPPDILEDVRNNFWGEGCPESTIWVSTQDGAGYALGTFAREQFKGRSELKLSKLERAVPKILGVLWVLQQKLNLPSKFSVSLGVLLPSAECASGDIEELTEKLLPELKSFVTPTGKVRVNLVNNLVIKPEGAGVYLNHRGNVAKDEFQRRKIGYLGLGYRNSNLLISSRGSVSDRDRHTDNLGFHFLVQSAKQEVGSAVNEIELATIIGEAGFDVNEVILERYLISINKLNRHKSLVETIKKAQKMYWHQLARWFDLVDVKQLDSFVFYGGTVEYLKPKLKEYFSFANPLVWHGHTEVPRDLLAAIIVEKEQTALNYRFIDCWCYLHYLCHLTPNYKQYGLDKLNNKEAVCV